MWLETYPFVYYWRVILLCLGTPAARVLIIDSAIPIIEFSIKETELGARYGRTHHTKR